MIEPFLALPLDVLERLHAAVVGQRLAVPVTETGLRAERLHPLVDFLPLLSGFGNARALELFSDAVVRQRRRERERPRPSLVWTGPEPSRGRARRTSVVIGDLLEGATREVFIAGYAFDGGAELLEPLHRKMAEDGLDVRIVFDCSRTEVQERTAPETILAKATKAFWRKTWPFGEPRPELYYDPRTLDRDPPRFGATWFPPVSMHAKCVVVDRCEVLVGSANFTARAQSDNLEVGIVLSDREFAETLLHQWQAAIAEGLVMRVLGKSTQSG